MAALILDYDLDASELAAAWWAHLPSVRQFRSRLLAITGMVVVVGLLVAYLRGAVWIAVPVVAAAVSALAYSGQRRQLEALTRATAALTGPTRVHADEAGIQFETGTARLWYAWENYQSLLDTPEGIGLVTGGGGVLRWIPGEAFAGEGERERLLDLARTGGASPGRN